MKMIATENGMIDLLLGSHGIVNDVSLETAIIISLLTDRRAQPDDIIPGVIKQSSNPLPPDRRGWAGDALSDIRIGSRLWLLEREKATEETRKRAIFYCEEALQWMIDDGHVIKIEVFAEWNTVNLERLDTQIIVTSINGDTQSVNISLRDNSYAL